MEYKINKQDKTITITDSAGKVDEIKSLMTLFPEYTLITGKPKRIQKYSREFIYEIQWNKILPVYMDNFSAETILMYP